MSAGLTHLGRVCAVAVFQDNPVPPGGELFIVGAAGDQHPVFFLVLEFGVSQAEGQVTVVGQQDQARTVHI